MNKIMNLLKRILIQMGFRIKSGMTTGRNVILNLPTVILNLIQDPRGIAKSVSNNIKSNKTRLLPLLAGLLIILLPALFITTKNPSPVEAGWWNDNWQFRQKVVISNSGSQQTDFQVGLDIDTSTAISSGKMRSDCTDIRVTDINGNEITEPWWLDNCNSTTSQIWVKFADIPTYSKVLYIYYGNPNATESAQSDGEDVFEFFDNFNDNSIDTSKWDYSDPGSGLTTSETSQVMRRSGTTSSGNQTNTLDTDDTFDKFRIEDFKVRINSQSGTELLIFGYQAWIAVLRYDGGTIKWQWWDGDSWEDLGT
jgi:hypothetical protein